jgi:hypothetical protein
MSAKATALSLPLALCLACAAPLQHASRPLSAEPRAPRHALRADASGKASTASLRIDEEVSAVQRSAPLESTLQLPWSTRANGIRRVPHKTESPAQLRSTQNAPDGTERLARQMN